MCCPDTPQSIFSSLPLPDPNLNASASDAEKDPYLGHRPIALAFAKFIETTPCLLRLSFPERVSDASPALSTIPVDPDTLGSFPGLDSAYEKTRPFEDERLDMYIARVVHWCQVPTIVPYAALYILTALARSFADSLECSHSCSVPGACSCSTERPGDVPQHSSRPTVRPRSFSSPLPERRNLKETIAPPVPPPPPPTPTSGSTTRTSKLAHALSFSLTHTRTRTRARAFSSPGAHAAPSTTPSPSNNAFPSMRTQNSTPTPTPTQPKNTPTITPHLLFLSSFLLTLQIYNNPSSNQYVPPPHTLSHITRVGPEAELEGLRRWMDGLVDLCDAATVDGDGDGVRKNVEGMVKDRWMGKICALEVPACACQRSRLGLELGPGPRLQFGRARSASAVCPATRERGFGSSSEPESGSGGAADAMPWAIDHGGCDEGVDTDVDGTDMWSGSESQNQQNWWNRWLNGSTKLATTTTTVKRPNSRRSSIGSMWDVLSSSGSYSSSSSHASSS